MLLELTHETVFVYGSAVTEALMEFRLTPLTDSSQHLLLHRQRTTPPVPIRQYLDAFGNTVSYMNVMAGHERTEVRFDSVVETHDTPFRGQGLAPHTPANPRARLLLHDYQRPTALTDWCQEFRAFVRPFDELRGAPPQEAAAAVMEGIHVRFRYEGGVTSVSSTVREFLQQGAGVCQDFAHLMLATSRHLGYAARYVSGYVLPDDGQEATASHAWCEIFDPEHGWFGMDATHNTRVGERYIVLGVGRDFRDVPPNRGVYTGSAAEEMQVHVHLRPITSDELDQRARNLYAQPRPRRSGTHMQKKAPAMSILEQSLQAQQQQQQQQ